jgi:succinyl-diaminopimelate desuccinylase
MSSTLDFAIELIERKSVTPEDAGCQQLIAERLQAVGFEIEHMRYGEVDNLWARHGTAEPILCFAGHTDVVPPGPLDDWDSDPFKAVVDGDTLRGRGAADMKSALAAMVDAATTFVAANPNHTGSIAF